MRTKPGKLIAFRGFLSDVDVAVENQVPPTIGVAYLALTDGFLFENSNHIGET